MNTQALQVAGVHVNYGDVVALQGADLTIEVGRVCALVGANGSGKSTLMNAIMGMVPLRSGTVQVFGKSPKVARAQGLIGYAPQNEAVDWQFPVSVHDVVMMGRYGKLGITRRPRPQDFQAVEQALERVELSELAGRQIGQLSGGQKKRAFVARAIAQQAQFLLLDEPFGGVDKRSEATIIRVLHELVATGVSILVSTHDLQALPQLADEMALINRRIMFHGSVAQGLRPEQLMQGFGVRMQVDTGPESSNTENSETENSSKEGH